MTKCASKQQKLAKLSNRAMEEQLTCFICITYQGKQNGSVLLPNDHEIHTEQMKQTQTLPILYEPHNKNSYRQNHPKF